MQKVLTAEQMREVDRLTTERYGIPSIILMENAAHAVARVITKKLGGSVKGKSILVLCGKGNNGGDGAALARILANSGAVVEAILFGKVSETTGNARTNFEILDRTNFGKLPVHLPYQTWKYANLTFRELEETERWNRGFRVNNAYDVVVDSLFGTGLDRSLESGFNRILESSWFEAEREYREGVSLSVSVDIPSGLPSDSGQRIGVNPYVDLTVTFTAPKLGNILPPAAACNGELVIANIGSPVNLVDDADSEIYLAEVDDVKRFLFHSKFSDDSYKNKRGHALIFAGSEDYSGAAVMSGNAAIRSGVGLVTLAVPASVKSEIAARILPEVIVRPIAEDGGEVSQSAFSESEELLKSVNSITVGPGLAATDKGVEKFVREIVENRTTPVVVDAGALWFFNPPDGIFQSSTLQKPAREQGRNTEVDNQTPIILTPHEGEFMRLLGTKDKEAIKDRVAAVREYAQKHDAILVLKGERVLIGAPDGRVVINPTGNSGLGKAGNGDTLTGILAGFVAQAAAMNIDIFETVVAAVYVAGMAGDVAEKKYGKRVMTASDVRDCLVDVFSELERSDREVSS